MTQGRDEPMTRPSLLLRLRDSGDQVSWQSFIQLYGPLIYRYCRGRGLQDADAMEVMQEVLLQVTKSIDAFDYQPKRGRFRGWLGTVTRNKVFRHLRDNANVPKPTESCGDDAPGEDVTWNDEFNRHLLSVALTKIQHKFQDDTWQAFQLVWLEERPAPEVAKLLNMPIEHVYVAKSRVLKQLKNAVQELCDDSPIFCY